MYGFRARYFQHLSLQWLQAGYYLAIAAQIPAEQKTGCPRLAEVAKKGACFICHYHLQLYEQAVHEILTEVVDADVGGGQA
jgi:hypothetical protein